MNRIVAFFMICLLGLPLFACRARSQGPYPEPETGKVALDKRAEFVEAFLRGRWCEAQSLFKSSTLDFLRQDDFCAAAYNYQLAWRLTAYLNIADDTLKARAARLAELGLDCGAGSDGLERGFVGPQDGPWEQLVQQEKFEDLEAKVRSASDVLYASVYGRKGARAAMDRRRFDEAKRLLETVRRRDADQGWLLFIIEDWKLLEALETDPARQELIRQRIERLEQLVAPCRPGLPESERP
jgi:hypothetical protein